MGKTIEEAAELYYLETKHRTPSCKKHFIEGYKLAQKRMYSEEDMKKAFKSSSLTNLLDVYESFEEFIKQFKKKQSGE